MKDQQKWFESLSVGSLHQRFAIDTEELGLIGTANLVDINWKDKNAHHGMLLGDKDMRGKGYAVDTIMTIMKYAFEELGLNRLDGSIIEYNEPSYGVYVKNVVGRTKVSRESGILEIINFGIKDCWNYPKRLFRVVG